MPAQKSACMPWRIARSGRSRLAAEASARYVEVEEWQLDEIGAGMADLDKGHSVTHEKVTRWLKSWGTRLKANRVDEGCAVPYGTTGGG